MKTTIALYMPALHQGYINFLTREGRKADTIFLIDEKLFKKDDPDLEWLFEKDLRAIPAVEMQKVLVSLGVSNEVKILDENNLQGFETVIIPDDDIVEKILSKFYPSVSPLKEDCFIRWGRKTVLSQRAPVADATISFEEFDKEMMLKSFALAQKSLDWWRQVGVILFPLNGEPIETFNRHVPHQQAPYIYGDPRTNFKPGENIDLSTAIHAEAGAIAYAARKGISLEGASIYVTTLPCPPCAWSIREAGIKKVYYCEGYSLLGVVEVFKSSGISLIFVDV
jgi:deoxycytidylate deaminase